MTFKELLKRIYLAGVDSGYPQCCIVYFVKMTMLHGPYFPIAIYTSYKYGIVRDSKYVMCPECRKRNEAVMLSDEQLRFEYNLGENFNLGVLDV